MNIPIISPGKWVDIEIFQLRGGNTIKVVKDKIQRKINKDDSQYYQFKKSKDTMEPQEFENIYTGSKGEDVLKLFSPTKGVYWPIKFVLKTVRPFSDAEQKYISESKDDIEKKNRIKEIYQKIYKAQFESVVDTATLNHGIYKIQKNALRFQGGGMDIATKMSILTIIIVIAFILCSWSVYNFFIQPGMIFWNDHSKEVVEVYRLQYTGTSTPAIQEPVPVPGG
jgi:hypothetical protein